MVYFFHKKKGDFHYSIEKDLPYEYRFLAGIRFDKAPYYSPFIDALFDLKREGTETGNRSLRSIAKRMIFTFNLKNDFVFLVFNNIKFHFGLPHMILY